MAERVKSKRKRPAAKKAAGSNAAALTGAVSRLEAKMKALQRERDGLRKQLDETKARVKELEDANTLAVNRIDWAIDSIHNLIDDGE